MRAFYCFMQSVARMWNNNFKFISASHQYFTACDKNEKKEEFLFSNGVEKIQELSS